MSAATNPEGPGSPSTSVSAFRRGSGSDRAPVDAARAVNLSEGQVFGDFRLLRTLGQGGMGTVWEAEQISLGRKVALKVIRADQLDAKSVRLFQREARAGGKLHHPGLVAVYATGESEGVHYIVQELVGDGHTLGGALAELRELPTMPEGYYRETASVVAEIAEAMQTAHELGVIHRDLKPHNILIDEQGAPKVGDFGLARINDELALSASLGMLGTLLYMSPEQAAAKSIGIDHRTDVFSLGVVMYEMLTLSNPFSGDTERQVLENILTLDPPPVRQLRSRVPRDLSIICEKALEKNRSHRYGSMRELAEDLRRYLANEPIQAQAPGSWRRAQKWALRHPTMSVSLGLCAVALVVITGLLFANIASRARAERSAESARQSATLAQQREREATVQREQADLERRRADLERSRVLRLADVKTLADLQRAATEDLWPIHPQRVPGLEVWLQEAESLVGRLPEHRAILDEMNAAGFAANSGLDAQQQEWWQQTLGSLVKELSTFADPEQGMVVELRARLEASRSLAERSVDGFAAAWEEAIEDLALNDRYDFLEVEPQMGLVPLGLDPDSGLWEFWHVQTGERPRRDLDTGRVVMEDDTGIVLVLIPGQEVWIGAQKDDPGAPCYDEAATPNETSQQLVLAPYFVSKFELTQGQWMRLAGSNPSEYAEEDAFVGRAHRRHPVEGVSWRECREVLRRVGLCLPTEAQWDHAARAGSAHPWWFGPGGDECARSGNVFDQSIYTRFPAPVVKPEAWRDGYAQHAPVGSFAANGHGLYDVVGNVWEWCEDGYVGFEAAVRFAGGNGLVLTPSSNGEQLVKGGSFNDPLTFCRIGNRNSYEADYRDDDVGVRPARVLD